MPRVLFGLQSAFTLWMLVDAARRGAAYYWYPIILLPFGELAYFFTVKIYDPEFRWLTSAWQRLTTRKLTIDQLRSRSEYSPSLENQVALAEGLLEKGKFHEARELFERLLKIDEESVQVLFGLGASRAGLEDWGGAVENFRALIELEPAHHDYEGWTMQADCLHRLGRTEEAAELMTRLVEKSPRLNHRMHYAHYLRLLERREDSKRQLEKGLQEHHNAPRFLRRQQVGWARQAKKMLQQLG